MTATKLPDFIYAKPFCEWDVNHSVDATAYVKWELVESKKKTLPKSLVDMYTRIDDIKCTDDIIFIVWFYSRKARVAEGNQLNIRFDKKYVYVDPFYGVVFSDLPPVGKYTEVEANLILNCLPK